MSKTFAFNFAINKSWSMQSNASDKSMRTAPVKNSLSSFSFHSSTSPKIKWFELYLLPEAETKSESMSLTWFSNLSFIKRL